MPVSVRVRFEVLKRDDFTCRYCGRRSPEVVLQVDHVVPQCQGGTDDPMNLVTSCWECNSGKGDAPLSQILTGEDPHDAAILLLERERQLREYNRVLSDVLERKQQALIRLRKYWQAATGVDLAPADQTCILNLLDAVPEAVLAEAAFAAVRVGKTDGLGYFNAWVKNWRARRSEASK